MILHIVRCDECRAEKSLNYAMPRAHLGSFETMTGGYSVPDSYMTVDGHHFCGYACLARYANKRASEKQSMVAGGI